jgi:hypothetical protein
MTMADKNDDAEYQEFLAQKRASEAAQAASAPEFYVHLADGNVVKLSQEDSDAAGSHYDGIAVIARYQVGA